MGITKLELEICKKVVDTLEKAIKGGVKLPKLGSVASRMSVEAGWKLAQAELDRQASQEESGKV